MIDSLIGQESVKNKLKFYADSFAMNKTSPFLLFQGAKGTGKTVFSRAYARTIAATDGRSVLELNSSSIKSNRHFFEVLYPQIQDRSVVLFFDEAHRLPDCLQADMLTILNTENHTKINYNWNGVDFEFDFQKMSFLFGTTDSQSLTGPLRDRMTVIDFEEYTKEDIRNIIVQNLKVSVDPLTIDSVSEVCRGNPRSCVLMAKDIERYVSYKNVSNFSSQEWEDFKRIMALKPLGLTSDESKIINVLRSSGPTTLTSLASVTGMERSFIQNVIEPYLVKQGLIKIDGTPVKRCITTKGIQIASTI